MMMMMIPLWLNVTQLLAQQWEIWRIERKYSGIVCTIVRPHISLQCSVLRIERREETQRSSVLSEAAVRLAGENKIHQECQHSSHDWLSLWVLRFGKKSVCGNHFSFACISSYSLILWYLLFERVLMFETNWHLFGQNKIVFTRKSVFGRKLC